MSKNAPKRLTRDLNEPLIRDALKGKFREDKISAKEQHQIYNQAGETESFTADDLKEKWDVFLSRLNKRPNLKATLADVPRIENDSDLILEIENSVQDDLVNSIKPELVSWLRKELKNSNIQLTSKITEKVREKVIYTDDEKFEEMMKKNPDLAILKKKFRLDFGA